MSQIDVQVVVVGASLAGASLAVRLARAGISVALIDREQFPRSKACGEGLALRGVRALEELGLNVTALPHVPLYGYHLFGRERELRLGGGEPPTALGIARSALDAAVIELARGTPRLSLILGERVEAIKPESCGREVSTSNHAIRAQFVVHAAGAGALPKVVRNREKRRCGVTLRVPLTRAHQLSMVTIEGRRGAELYLTPIDPYTLNLTLLGDRERMREERSGGLAALWSPLLNRLGVLSAVACDLAQCVPEGAGCVSGLRGEDYRGAELWVGDAVETLDPCGGAGMSHALLSAQHAAQALLEILCERRAPQLALAGYAERRERDTRPLRGHTALVRAALSVLHCGALALPGAQTLGGMLLGAAAGSSRHRGVMQLCRLVGACA